MKDKFKKRWQTLKDNIKHYVLTFLYWLYNLSGDKLFKIRPNDITMGGGYKRHYLAENNGQKLYMSEERRKRVLSVMTKADEYDKPESPMTEIPKRDIDGLREWERKARILNVMVEKELKNVKTDRKE